MVISSSRSPVLTQWRAARGESDKVGMGVVKVGLRDCYKQADLEAIALKYVHRKGLSFLITLEENEARSVKAKIKSGDVIGLDNVIVATSEEFNELILELKTFEFSEPPTVKVIESNQIITEDKVSRIK